MPWPATRHAPRERARGRGGPRRRGAPRAGPGGSRAARAARSASVSRSRRRAAAAHGRSGRHRPGRRQPRPERRALHDRRRRHRGPPAAWTAGDPCARSRTAAPRSRATELPLIWERLHRVDPLASARDRRRRDRPGHRSPDRRGTRRGGGRAIGRRANRDLVPTCQPAGGHSAAVLYRGAVPATRSTPLASAA